MTIRSVITEVLDKRHKKVLTLEKAHAGLVELEMQIDSIRQMATDIQEDSNDIPAEIVQLTTKIARQISGLEEEIIILNESITSLTKRFSKETINIGVAGKARQGKSTLLQKISGLSNKEIPTSDELPCTGTKSKIHHYEDDAYAKIEFYTKEEFLKEILHPYFDKLKLPKPFSLKRFNEPLPELSENASLDRNLDKAIYEKLIFIHKSFPTFFELLSKQPKTLELEEILDYVTQNEGRTRYLAVKTANIFTKFPNYDVTGLCLVDLPGLEAAQGHEKKLVSSLEYEVDAIIFVKSPDILGTDWEQTDYNVFDLVDNAVREIELSQRLFIILNQKSDGSNKKQVQLLKEQPPETYSKPPILIADCSDSKAVEEQVFSIVLKHIEQNLESTDRKYLDMLTKKTNNIFTVLNQAITPVLSTFTTSNANLNRERKYRVLSEQFIRDLTKGLEKLVLDVQKELNISEEFKQKVEEICELAKQQAPIPNKEELAEQYLENSGWKGVVSEELNYLRAYLTEFLATQLDEYLQNKVNSTLRQVLERIFPKQLQNMLPQDAIDSDEPRAVILEFQAMLDQAEQPNIYRTFNYIHKFNFSYHSHFHYRVREEMGLLNTYTSDSIDDIVPQDATRDNFTEKAEEIARGLETHYHQTIYQLRKKFGEKMQADPANAILALVEEVKDRLVRAKGIKEEWKSFLDPIREQLWEDELRQFNKEIALRTQWRNALDDALKGAKSINTAFPD
ncbi:MAG: dynamin family protein [Thiomargarita sp.]|nr:dynamin family protein [Thiomargarita sp.]